MAARAFKVTQSVHHSHCSLKALQQHSPPHREYLLLCRLLELSPERLDRALKNCFADHRETCVAVLVQLHCPLYPLPALISMIRALGEQEAEYNQDHAGT